jgi:hypothetical protein
MELSEPIYLVLGKDRIRIKANLSNSCSFRLQLLRDVLAIIFSFFFLLYQVDIILICSVKLFNAYIRIMRVRKKKTEKIVHIKLYLRTSVIFFE